MDKKAVKGLVLGKKVGSKERSGKIKCYVAVISAAGLGTIHTSYANVATPHCTASCCGWLGLPRTLKAIASLGQWAGFHGVCQTHLPTGQSSPRNKLIFRDPAAFSWTLIFHRTCPVIILDLR